MKSLWKLAIVVMLGVFVTQPAVFAEAGDEHGALIEVGNKVCPVSGEKVGKMGDPFQVEYNGKLYNLCCKMCVKDFQKDPEKYAEIAEEETQSGHADHDMKHEDGEKESHEDHGGHGDHGHDAHHH